jgi:hypothetical protein
MAKRLLDRQVSLLRYLTSAGAIFGAEDPVPLDPALRGIEPSLLGIEARFSYEKRMEKIFAVFPKTFELLGADRDRVIRAFVDACPPVDISRIENARQFHDFLHAQWQREAPRPPYVPDVAACEFAFAKVRIADEVPAEEPRESVKDPLHPSIRRRPGVLLLRCSYDVRTVFEDGSKAARPVERDISLAFAPGADRPLVSELEPVACELLIALSDWTDPAAFGDAPEANELIAELIGAGLLEERR